MTDKTKKRLTAAGLTAVCVGLAIGIGWNLNANKGNDFSEIVKAEEPTVQAEVIKTEQNDNKEQVAVNIPVTTEPKKDETEQTIQETPVKTENEKPTEPPETTGETTSPAQVPEYKEETTTPQATTSDSKPKSGDMKDGFIYIEGYGWLPDEGEGVGILAEDMYQNGNKVGSMD